MKQSLFMWMLIIASAFSLSSCSSDDDDSGLSQKEIILKVGQSMTLSYGGGECTWSSDQPLIAEVDNNGNVTANRVGITNIKANGDICKVTVNPNYTTYEEPYLKFGASMNEVKNAMSGYTLSSKTDANNLVYIGKNVIDYYDYMFKNNGLYAVILATDIFKGAETSKFLAERYIVVSIDENAIYAIKEIRFCETQCYSVVNHCILFFFFHCSYFFSTFSPSLLYQLYPLRRSCPISEISNFFTPSRSLKKGRLSSSV